MHRQLNAPPHTVLLSDGYIQSLLPPRPHDAHKGNCGHALIFAGSTGMAGAAALCAMGALRGGAGLATVCCPDSVLSIVQTLAPCAMAIPLHLWEKAIKDKDAIAYGPGLQEAALPHLSAVCSAGVPLVLDADGLNALSTSPMVFSCNTVLTPHPGEAARLLGMPIHDVLVDPWKAAIHIALQYHTLVLLKGADTIITDGTRHALNPTGTPGMATGGSGDVLTGIIVAFLAQGLSPFDAACAGAFHHGLAGERAAQVRGMRSMTAWDLLDTVRID